METEHYGDGQHNGGIFNSFNHGSYGYCYQNPVRLVDPNGKQVESEYLSLINLSTSSSFANGVIDGFIGSLDPTVSLRMVNSIITNPKVRAAMFEMANKIADDPVGFVKQYAVNEYGKITRVINGNGSDQDYYDAGERVGGLVTDVLLAIFTAGAGNAAKTSATVATETAKGVIKKAVKEVVDLVGDRKVHILNRHRAGAGKPGKTEFPAEWSDQRILDEVNKIANDLKANGGVGKWESPFKTGTVDGIEIRVDFYPPTHPKAGKVSTAYPTNTTPNPTN